MKKALLFCATLLPLTAAGQLVVTEINSKASPADFWELTNFGTAMVNLGGYVWKDSTDINPVSIPAGTTIDPNESIMFVVSTDAAAFRAAWNLAPAVKVLALAGDPGLGQNDSVRLFNSTGASVASLSYTAAGFTRSNGTFALGGHAGPSAGAANDAQSLILDPNYPLTARRYTFATGGNFSSWTTADGSIGSPGKVGSAASNSAPYFTGVNEAFATVGQDLVTSTFRVQATDADLGQTVAYTLVSGPSWLTLFPDGFGNARLVGPPPTTSAGTHPFTVRATDNATPTTASTERVYSLTVVPATSPVLVNEYNAVNSGKFLNGGTVSADADLGTAADLHFGRVEENGGDWVELVVVGGGTPGAVDLRGWTIELSQTTAGGTNISSRLLLSQAPYWSAVPTGTILTFIERNTSQGGLNTGIGIRNRRATLGDAWTNIWIGDPVYLTYTDEATNGYTVTAGVVSGVAVDERDTRIVLRNAVGTVVAGPFGEGLPEGVNVSDTEVMALNANPAPSVSPFAVADNDLGIPGFKDKANKSSFGLPNEWGLVAQSFAAFIRAATPYETWAAGFGLSDPSPGADPDGDGRSNRAEYAFGGNPAVADGPAGGQTVVKAGSTVTWQYARRADDPSLVYFHQRSGDLAGWQTLVPTSTATAAHPTLAGFVMVTVTAPAAPVSGREFFRAALAP